MTRHHLPCLRSQSPLDELSVQLPVLSWFRCFFFSSPFAPPLFSEQSRQARCPSNSRLHRHSVYTSTVCPLDKHASKLCSFCGNPGASRELQGKSRTVVSSRGLQRLRWVSTLDSSTGTDWGWWFNTHTTQSRCCKIGPGIGPTVPSLPQMGISRGAVTRALG